jgi:hypothetical protein
VAAHKAGRTPRHCLAPAARKSGLLPARWDIAACSLSHRQNKHEPTAREQQCAYDETSEPEILPSPMLEAIAVAERGVQHQLCQRRHPGHVRSDRRRPPLPRWQQSCRAEYEEQRRLDARKHRRQLPRLVVHRESCRLTRSTPVIIPAPMTMMRASTTRCAQSVKNQADRASEIDRADHAGVERIHLQWKQPARQRGLGRQESAETQGSSLERDERDVGS